MNKIIEWLLEQAADARTKAETAGPATVGGRIWTAAGDWNELLAAKLLQDDYREKFLVAVKEGSDGVAGFAIAVILGAAGRPQMEALGGPSQVAERAGFEAGLKARPIIGAWVVGQVFGREGLPAWLRTVFGGGK